jgi:hypothetical protein
MLCDDPTMVERRGEVFIAPQAFLPPGVPVDARMVDPASALFWASWQNEDGDEGTIERVLILGADRAIDWGRERSDLVWIRLGHHADTLFSAGAVPDEDSRAGLLTHRRRTAGGLRRLKEPVSRIQARTARAEGSLQQVVASAAPLAALPQMR